MSEPEAAANEPTEAPQGARCPSTSRAGRYRYPAGVQYVGVQCKFTEGHEGDHAADGENSRGDVFWSQDSAPEAREWAPTAREQVDRAMPRSAE
jgi:hypothetical protein